MKKKQKKLIHEGNCIAEKDVEFLYDETGWSPCLTLEDANKQ